MRVYLAGPIAGCDDVEAKDWRAQASALLDSTCVIDDPMRRDYRGKLPDDPAEVVVGDLRDIDRSEAVLANCWKPSTGTAMEIMYAHNEGKIVIVVAPDPVSPWLRCYSSVVFSTVEEACARLKVIAGRL